MREQPLLLSALPPSPGQARACAVVAIGLLAAALATVPFSTVQLPRMDAFIPVVDTALVLSDLITASLLLAQFSVQRSRAVLVLASGYLFTGLIMIPHALTFPGAFSATGLLGAGFNTTIWLYYFWHFGLPVAVIGYALTKDAEGTPVSLAQARRAIFASLAGVPALVLALTVLTTDWWELKTGFTTQVTRATSFYASVGYQRGNDGDRYAYDGKIGMRMQW